MKRKKKTKLGQVLIKELSDALDFANGYRLGKVHAAEMADVILRNHGASKIVRNRMRKAILKTEKDSE